MTTYGQWKQGTAEFLMSPMGYAFHPLEAVSDIADAIVGALGWYLSLPFFLGVFVLGFYLGLVIGDTWTPGGRLAMLLLGLLLVIVPAAIVLISVLTNIQDEKLVD